jgi:hypothetical protein
MDDRMPLHNIASATLFASAPNLSRPKMRAQQQQQQQQQQHNVPQQSCTTTAITVVATRRVGATIDAGAATTGSVER